MTTKNLKQVDKAALGFIANGGAVLGSGGGGDPYIGRLMAEHALGSNTISVVSVDDLDDDALIMPVAMMGAPQVMQEKFPSHDNFHKCISTVEKLMGRKVSALFCIEAGGLNSVIPFIASAELNLPIVDGDAMGRAFPELQMVSFTLGGIQATPMAMFDEKGNGATFTTISNTWTEKLARAITIEMGGSAIVALYPVTAEQARNNMIKGSLSQIHRIGQLMTEHGSNATAAIAEDQGGVILFQGRVRDVERASDGGFTKGKLLLEGQGDFRNRTTEMRFQNEFISIEEEGRSLATTPDLLTLMDVNTGVPVPTDLVKYGLSVYALGLPSPDVWKTPEGLKLVGPEYFGLDVDYVPL
ncbi:MAG: DUF917 domain-containing protein [Aliishimia sp.]